MKLIIKNKTYPNGNKFKQVFVSGKHLGNYDITDAGFIPDWCKKPRTENEAILHILRRNRTYYSGLLSEIEKQINIYALL